MIKKLSIAFVCFCTGVVSFAQNNDYFNLKDVKTYRFDHLELSTDKEIDQFIQDPAAFNFIEALKINQTNRLNEIISGTGLCNFIKELDLKEYHGDINASTFDSCKGVEILHLSLNEEKLEQLKFLSGMSQLADLYLYIVGKPENLDGLSLLPVLKQLHIIGDFLPKDIAHITTQIQNQTYLQELGISIDRITDIPQSITRFKTLSRLNLYDNLSVFTNKGIEDLNEEKISILFNIYSDQINAIAISYFSNNGKLADFETEYLQSVYKGELLPQQFEAMELENVESGSIPFKKEFIPDFPLTAEFNKPYPKLFPNTEIIVVNPVKNSIVYSNSGMKISIASGSFVNETGIDITDPVYLKITQMNTPTDLLFAGLNLKNGDRQFCNQFLFNIQASTERSAAILKEGFQIKVSIPVAADSSITYFFDYESNTWQDLNFYNQIFAANFTPIDFYKFESNGAHTSHFLFDTAAFKDRFLSKDNYLLNDKGNNSQLLFRSGDFFTDLDRTWNKDYNKDGKLKGLKIKRGKSYVKIQKVIPKVRNKDRQYFKLLDKTEQGILSELSAFKKINFNVAISIENKKEFNENFVRNSKYYDIQIHYSKGKEFCDITLKTSDGFKKLQAFITDTEDKKLLKKQMKKFMQAYKKYIRIRAKRELEFNTLNAKRFEEFKVYSNEKIKALQKNNTYSEVKIHQLGTFGFMYDREPVFTTNIIAQYTDESGLPIDVKNLYLIDSRYNSVFKKETGNISFDPENISCIIATDYSGNLYYANKSDIAASHLSNNSLTYIKLKKVNPGINTISVFNQMIRN